MNEYSHGILILAVQTLNTKTHTHKWRSTIYEGCSPLAFFNFIFLPPHPLSPPLSLLLHKQLMKNLNVVSGCVNSNDWMMLTHTLGTEAPLHWSRHLNYCATVQGFSVDVPNVCECLVVRYVRLHNSGNTPWLQKCSPSLRSVSDLTAALTCLTTHKPL